MRARVPVPWPNQEFEEDFDNVSVEEEELLDEEEVLEMELEELKSE